MTAAADQQRAIQPSEDQPRCKSRAKRNARRFIPGLAVLFFRMAGPLRTISLE
jgi:hypothetical protein